MHYGKIRGARLISGAKLKALLWTFWAVLTRLRYIFHAISLENSIWSHWEILEKASGEHVGGVLLVSLSAVKYIEHFKSQ